MQNIPLTLTDPYADGFRWTLVSNYKSKGKYDAALAELELIKEPEWVVHWERNQIYQQKEIAQRVKPILEKIKAPEFTKAEFPRFEYRKEDYQRLKPALEREKAK